MNSNKELFFCPLECGARIKNFYKHIVKCRKKNKLNVEYFICPYNINHILNVKVFAIHKENCEDKPNPNSEDSDDEDIVNKFKTYEENENENSDNSSEDDDNNKKDCVNKKRKKYIKTTYDKEEDIDEDSLKFFNKVYLN